MLKLKGTFAGSLLSLVGLSSAVTMGAGCQDPIGCLEDEEPRGGRCVPIDDSPQDGGSTGGHDAGFNGPDADGTVWWMPADDAGVRDAARPSDHDGGMTGALPDAQVTADAGRDAAVSTAPDASIPTAPDASTPSSAARKGAPVAAGLLRTCAVRDNGTVSCWGGTPTDVPGITDAVGVVVGSARACALHAGGTVSCWEYVGSGLTIKTPPTLVGVQDVVALSAGAQHVCSLHADATVRCWGSNTDGQLGTSAGAGVAGADYPPNVVNGIKATQVAAGARHTCALLQDGTVSCWGGNMFGELGDATTQPSTSPKAISTTLLTGVTALAAGNGQTCASQGGAVSCWGGTNGKRTVPTPLVGITGVVELTVGGAHACGRLSDGTVSCWGINRDGQLGHVAGAGSRIEQPPGVVTDLSGAIAIAAGGSHTCARLRDDSVKCWGSNTDGELGRAGDGANVPSDVAGF